MAKQGKVETAVNVLENKIADLNIATPKTWEFILSSGLVESGSAYTREGCIVMSTNMLDDIQTQEEVNHLIAHEFFYAYSRLHKEHCDELYGTINFKKLPPVSLPRLLKSVVITNPDLPTIEYGVELE